MTSHLLKVIFQRFYELKRDADNAMLQLVDQHTNSIRNFFTPLDSLQIESNSIATLYKHVAEVLQYRFTEIRDLGNDAPRLRDAGLTIFDDDSIESIRLKWNTAWSLCFNTLEGMSEDHLARTLIIRQQTVTVQEAILTQLSHAAVHQGQIIMLAKHFAGEKWKPLTIAKKPSK